MIEVTATFAGIGVVIPGADFNKTHPYTRVNFFDIPWTASVPGFGNILVHTEDLIAIESGLVENGGRGDLILECWEDGILLESVILPNLYPIKATPVLDHFMRVDEFDNENLTSTKPTDTLVNSKGLMILEIQDSRAVDMMLGSCIGDVWNVQDTKGKWTNSKDENTPYRLDELFPILIPGNRVKVTLPPIFSSIALQNVSIGSIPVLTGIDLLINAAIVDVVAKYDITKSSPEVTIVPFDQKAITALQNLISSSFPDRMWGGTVRNYPVAQAATRMQIWYWDKGQFVNKTVIATASSDTQQFRDFGPKEGSLLPVYAEALIDPDDTALADKIFKPRLVDEFHQMYRGFKSAFLDVNLPLSMVSYSWNSGCPITEVRLENARPVRTLLNSPQGWFAKNYTLKSGANARITPEGQGASGKVGFFGIVTSCDHVSKLGKVKRTNNGRFDGIIDPNNPGPDIVVYVGENTWHDVGDLVCVSPTDGYPGWYVSDKITGFKYATPSDLIEGEIPGPRGNCTATITPEIP